MADTLIEAIKDAPASSRADMDLARGKAADAYAELEHTLMHIFSHAFRYDGDPTNRRDILASFTFQRLLNKRARNEVIAHILETNFQTEHEKFRNTLMDELQKCDGLRDRIVHSRSISRTYEGRASSLLVSDHKPSKPLTIPDIEDAITRFQRLKKMLHIIQIKQERPDDKPYSLDDDTLHEIYRAPFQHPLPSDHPLAL